MFEYSLIQKILPILPFEFNHEANQITFLTDTSKYLPVSLNTTTIEELTHYFSKDISPFFVSENWGNKTFSAVFKDTSLPADKAQVCSILVKQIRTSGKLLQGILINLSSLLDFDYLKHDVDKLVSSLPEIRKITHDINNKYQIITGFGSVIEDETNDPEIKDCAENIMSALDDAIELNKQLRMLFPKKSLPNIFNTKTQNQVANIKETVKTDVKESEIPDASNKTAKILVIDDELMVQRFLCEMIKRLKFIPTGVNDGKAAIDAVSNNDFDLAILDMNLPDMDSKEVFSIINEKRPELKIILISGEDLNDSFQKLLDRGACGFVQKPTSVKKLSETINNALKNK